MYAIVLTGGKQYKVEVGTVFKAEKLDAKVGDKVSLKVLMYSDGTKVYAGEAYVKNVTVNAEILDQGKDKKIIVFKYKAKKGERKKQGHRQPYTQLKVLAINGIK